MPVKKSSRLESILRVSLCALLFLIPLQTVWIYSQPVVNGFVWEFGTMKIYLTEIILWFSCILFLFWFWEKLHLYKKKKKITFSFTKDRAFTMAVGAFIVYCLISTLWAIHPELALQQALWVMAAGIVFFMLYLGPVPWHQASIWFIIGATTQGVLGIVQFFTQSVGSTKLMGMGVHHAWEGGSAVLLGESIGRWLRAYGTFPHPNILGGFLCLSLIISILFFSSVKRGKSVWDPLFRYTIIGIQLFALFVTFSKSAWIAFGLWVFSLIAFFLVYYTAKSHKVFAEKAEQFTNFSLFCVCGIVALVLFFQPLVASRFLGNAPHELRSVSERISGYAESLHIFSVAPLTGVGVGNYTVAAMIASPGAPGWQYQPVHNVILLVFAELGFLGATLALLILCYFLVYFFSRVPKKYPEYTLFFLLLCMPYGILLLFDHYLFSSYSGLIFGAVYFGLVGQYMEHVIHNLSTSTRKKLRK